MNRLLIRQLWFLLSFLLASILLAGCKPRSSQKLEFAYVAAPQATLRDRVAALSNRVATLKNGDRVQVLERARRFVRVRTTRNEEGWVEERYLVGPEIYEAFENLAKENATAPVQSHAVTRGALNLHLEPGRDTEHLYQLAENEKLDVLKRATADKPQARVLPARPPAASEKASARPAAEKSETLAIPLEDWYLVRGSQKRTGWVLARMIDIDLPVEVAQYAEGQRIVAYFVLNDVKDEDKPVPQYLVLFTEPKDGLPFDYNQVRIFTRNTKRHRYETAYRERNLFGILPVTTGNQDFGKEGNLPTFTLRLKDEQGNTVERKYKLNGVMVRRVLAPGEEKQQKLMKTGGSRSKKKR